MRFASTAAVDAAVAFSSAMRFACAAAAASSGGASAASLAAVAAVASLAACAALASTIASTIVSLFGATSLSLFISSSFFICV